VQCAQEREGKENPKRQQTVDRASELARARALCGRQRKEAICYTAAAQSSYCNPTLVPRFGVEFQ
jgi:hypothetical protein